MNVINAEIEHPFFATNRVEKFKNKIDNTEVSIWSSDKRLYINIYGRKTVEKIEALMLEIFSLLFIYLGSFAKIIKIESNHQSLDNSNYVGKVDTWEYYVKSNFVICQISDVSINERVIQNYRRLKLISLYSMQYLVSNTYRSVITNHKLTLLLHVIDGIVPDSVVDVMKTEIASKFQIRDKVGNYEAKVYFLCKSTFFNFHKKYKCEILPLLKATQYKYVHIVSNTRNWYSHFLADNKKPDRLRDGAEMLIYFDIIFYSIRIFLIKEIGVPINEKWIKEYLYCIHDWILEIKYRRREPLKSKTYKINQMYDEMKRIIKEI
ncbi:hypothetical protein HNQ56_003459 [Anaerotaenia torta]|uniref:HEPN domain-containing protein n=1 Tax=Anaerotaenia torta TaxID=433293 RepID=UPI003D217564